MIAGTPRMQLLIARDLRDDRRSIRPAPGSIRPEQGEPAPCATAEGASRVRPWRPALLRLWPRSA